MKQEVFTLLRKITGMPHIVLTSRGNEAIRLALTSAKNSGCTKVLIPDQGGWFAFKKMPAELGLAVEELKTEYGVLDIAVLKQKITPESALLYENPAGYYAKQPCREIYEACKGKCTVILDATGCIGRGDYSRFCDIMIGSFGDTKPVNLGYGGFVAAHIPIEWESDFDESFAARLEQQLGKLGQAYNKYDQIRTKIMADLKEHEILHREKQGINVIVKCKDKAEMEKIINYCNANSLQFVKCPFYIRVKTKAISIEVKRVK